MTCPPAAATLLSLVALTFGAAVFPACTPGSGTGATGSGGGATSSSHGSSTSSGGAGGAGGGSSSSSATSSSAGSTTSTSSTSTSSTSSSGAPACTTLITTADLNLRSGPGTSFSVVDVIPDGSTVTLLAPAEQNGFYNVAYQTESGWSSASYLEPDCSTSSSSSSSSSSGATVWSCTGLYGTIPMANGEYYATEFGCYIDANGDPQQDPGDNCIPACLSQAQGSGLCAGMSGPDCEDAVSWYSADGGRFGCLTRLKVTNQANGKAVVVVVLDYGPACSVEATVQHAAIDLSYPADDYLFGMETGISDEALVHVDVVDASTALGPVP
jgi:uncharacterized protein YraI